MMIREDNKWKKAIQTWYGYFEYQLMFFGHFNALASFQGYVHKILAKKLNVFVIVYLDNILINIEDPGQSYVKAVGGLFINSEITASLQIRKGVNFIIMRSYSSITSS